MLRSCSKDEFCKYVDFAYELALDLTRSGYPTYCDEIKTKAMFVERCYKAFDRENEEILLFEADGEVKGVILYFWLPEDRYLETLVFNVGKATEKALSEFLNYIGERFKGYDAYFGFPRENASAVSFLAEKGFECITDEYMNTAFLDRLETVQETDGVVRIDRDNYGIFKTLHRQTEDEMYFTAGRIPADIDNWSIFVKETDRGPQGAVYYTKLAEGWFEIYGTDMIRGENDLKLYKELINTALSDAKRRGGRFMTYLCEKEYEEAALECGFKCIGNELCFKTRLGS